MSAILKLNEYTTFNICGDLNVIGILKGMQQGYTKFYCFLCEWDSRDIKMTISVNGSLKENNFLLGKKTYHMNHF